MVIVIMLCMVVMVVGVVVVVVIMKPICVIIVEIYVYVLCRKLYSVSNKYRLIHYNLSFKTGINELRKPQINGSVRWLNFPICD
jgi:hypothetical protein